MVGRPARVIFDFCVEKISGVPRAVSIPEAARGEWRAASKADAGGVPCAKVGVANGELGKSQASIVVATSIMSCPFYRYVANIWATAGSAKR